MEAVSVTYYLDIYLKVHVYVCLRI